VLIWAGTAGPVRASRLLSLRPMVWVGLISYSLYLWHWPIMAFLRNRLFTVELEPMWQVATVSAALLAGWISWRVIERPFRVPVREGGMTQRRIFALSGAGMAAMSALAGAVVLTSGMAPQRFDEKQLADHRVMRSKLRAHMDCFGARRKQDLCRFGETDAKATGAWLVWGDSHALMLVPALEELAKSSGKTLMLASKGDCAPLPGLLRTDRSAGVNSDCNAFKRDILDFALQSQTIETVILVARWPLYVEGRRVKAEGARQITFYDPETRLANGRAVSDGLNSVAKTLASAGKDIVVVGTAAEIPWDVLRHLEANLLFGRLLPQPVTLSAIADRQAGIDAILNDLEGLDRVTVVRLTEEACQPVCLVRDGFVPFYKDFDHLTPEGAHRIAKPAFEKLWASQSESVAR